LAAFDVALGIDHAKCQFGQRHEIPKTMQGQFAARLTVALECRSMMPEFYLVLNNHELDEQLENAVFGAGFDDSELTIRGDRAAIWICHREGELTDLVRQALAQARVAKLDVSHVEIESCVFA
jgi:hypothetical protein